MIGRCNTADPLAEDCEHASPYNYTLNNPVNNTDPDGMSVDGPVDIRNDYHFDSGGKLVNVVIKPGDDHFYQTDQHGKTSELNGNQLNEVVIKGKRLKSSSLIAPYVLWNASMGEAGIQMSFPIEGLFPGLKAFSAVSSIFDLVNRPALTKKSGKDKASDIPSWEAG